MVKEIIIAFWLPLFDLQSILFKVFCDVTEEEIHFKTPGKNFKETSHIKQR